ncbi:polymorphic toxin type 27 domain-containing protein [Streptomyces sp. NPDC059697]|uniref:polymorphic toxin type 27 domain-containing protein n=1 Tax=Streptomyces sp. NPDC059697 TaxID=3346912 RepID=UPI0036B15DD1
MNRTHPAVRRDTPHRPPRSSSVNGFRPLAEGRGFPDDAKTAAEALNKFIERGKPLVGGDWEKVAKLGSNNGTAWEVARLRLKVILERRNFDAVDWYFTKPGDKVPSLVKDMPKPDRAQ